MRSWNQVFIIFCLTLTTGILWSYAEFSGYFNSGWELKKDVQVLSEKLDDSEFRVSLLQHQMKDLEQTVASEIPKAKLNKSDKFYDLGLTLRAPASIKHLDFSAVTSRSLG